MKFPEVERVIYQKNPLVEVVCQCMFPRILAIDEGIPATFQQKLGCDEFFVRPTAGEIICSNFVASIAGGFIQPRVGCCPF